MKSPSSHNFARIPAAEIQRSSFNRSSGLKTTFDAGLLIPIFTDEALPGDTLNLKMTTFCRLSTPLFPVLDNMQLETFFFAVPNRLLWDHWVNFNGEKTNPDDSTVYTIPQITSPGGSGEEDSLSDYLGIPPDATNFEHSSLWHRAYNLIWNEWFRDQNLQDSLVVDTDDGPDTYADYELQRRGKRHDYFTSCLPWPQKGTAVLLPLGTSAPVSITGGSITGSGAPTFDGSTSGTNSQLEGTGGGTTAVLIDGITGDLEWNTTNLVGTSLTGVTDLTAATAATINEIRQAFQIQRLYERDARGGSRYTEIVRSHFGVISPDARLQRPEFLGGGSQTINITPVAATNQGGSVQLGRLGAFGVSSGTHGFNKSFTEHCVIIGLVMVKADLTYQQGVKRQFLRTTRWDYFWPALAHLGEQSVTNAEIYAQGDANDDLTFGYQERFAEYRYMPSSISAQFRTSTASDLDQWHLAQQFSSLPTLGEDFIEENPPIDRVVADSNAPHLLFDAYFDYKCARPMPTYSVPGLIDHF